jgi:group I intron endonuclease
MQIYCIRNKINGKCYVGQTRSTFEKRYCKFNSWWNRISNFPLKNSVKKHGHQNFEILILEHGQFSQQELNNLEIQWADKMNSYCPHGYNLRKCGNAPGFVSSETRRKMSDAKLGKSASWNSREFTAEHRDKLSKAKLGKPTWNKGLKDSQKAWNKGKSMSEESKAKLSESKLGTKAWNKGKSLSEAHRQSLKEAWIRRKQVKTTTLV